MLAPDWSRAVTGSGPDLGHICTDWPGPSCSGSGQLLTLNNNFFVLFCEKINEVLSLSLKISTIINSITIEMILFSFKA